jgi:membrane associated rhomboid family serine protease
MVFAPVGIRCPEHAGRGVGPQKVVRQARRWSYDGAGAIVTKGLVAANIAIYLLELAFGGSTNGVGSAIYEKGVLVASAQYADGTPAGVANGDWWRLITSAFLHYGPIHLAINMFSLWIAGSILEPVLGRGRFLLLYLVAGLAGAAGALLADPHAMTAGASGAVFGLFGALLILEYQQTGTLLGQFMTLIVVNLAFSFLVPGISWGGHVGGLIGGALGTLALSRFGRGHAAYGRLGALGVAALVAVGVASVLIAYWKVRGYA